MSSQGGLHHKTNHSARKTGIQMLLHENLIPTNIAQISDHRNIQLLNSYSYMSDEQKNISKTLSKKIMSILYLADLSTLIPSSLSTISNEIVEEFMSDWEPNDNNNQTEIPVQLFPATILDLPREILSNLNGISKLNVPSILAGAVFNGAVNVHINMNYK